METRKSKKEQIEIFERRSAKKRQPLEEREYRLQEKERQLGEERRQLQRDWQRYNEEYEAGKKLINELWAEGEDETGDGEPEPRLEETQDAPISHQRKRSPSPNGTSRRSISEEVLLIVDEWQDDLPITQSEVTRRFEKKYPDRRPSSLVSLISHTLSQSANDEDGVLELVEKGAGSRPAKYRKKVKREEAQPLEP